MDLAEIILCGHKNPMGCPNHGDVVREIVAMLQYEFSTGRRARYSFADHESEPIPYVLTDKGKAAASEPTDTWSWLP